MTDARNEMEPTTPLDALRNMLRALEPGPVLDRDRVVPLLQSCWLELTRTFGLGHGMSARKLDGAEQMMWDPPHLEFNIERHEGVVSGSRFAKVERWTVDTVKGVAWRKTVGARERGTVLFRIRDVLTPELMERLFVIAVTVPAQGAASPSRAIERERGVEELAEVLASALAQVARPGATRDKIEAAGRALAEAFFEIVGVVLPKEEIERGSD